MPSPLVPRDLRNTADLARVTEAVGNAVRAAERAQVLHLAIAPEEGMAAHEGTIGRADNLAGSVDGVRAAVRAAERAQVLHLAIGPEEGVNGRLPSGQ